jgi:hypothetical protein
VVWNSSHHASCQCHPWSNQNSSTSLNATHDDFPPLSLLFRLNNSNHKSSSFYIFGVNFVGAKPRLIRKFSFSSLDPWCSAWFLLVGFLGCGRFLTIYNATRAYYELKGFVRYCWGGESFCCQVCQLISNFITAKDYKSTLFVSKSML